MSNKTTVLDITDHSIPPKGKIELPSPKDTPFLDYLCSVRVWANAYKSINKFVDNNQMVLENLNAMIFDNGLSLKEILLKLRSKEYDFSPPDRKLLPSNPKPGQKVRTVYYYPNPKINSDYYIIHIMYMWLTERYDHLFADTLFSYRTSLGVPGAVNYLKEQIHEKGNLDSRLGYKADVSKYFHSVNIDLLLKDLKRTVSPNAYFYIEKLLLTGESFDGTEKYDAPGIYPGLSISSFLANFYLRRLDWYFCNRGITYCRYADDILLFADTNKQLKSYVRRIKWYLGSKKLIIHPKKEESYPGSRPIEFLGLKFENGRFDLNHKSYLRRKTKIRKICSKARSNIVKILATLPDNRKEGQSKRNYMDKILKGTSCNRPKFMVRNRSNVLHSPLYREIRMLVRKLNNAHFGPSSNHKRSFMGWYFNLIGTDETLRRLDQFCLQEIRYAITGKRGLAAAKLVSYDYLKRNYEYHPLVSEWRRTRYFK